MEFLLSKTEANGTIPATIEDNNDRTKETRRQNKMLHPGTQFSFVKRKSTFRTLLIGKCGFRELFVESNASSQRQAQGR